MRGLPCTLPWQWRKIASCHEKHTIEDGKQQYCPTVTETLPINHLYHVIIVAGPSLCRKDKVIAKWCLPSQFVLVVSIGIPNSIKLWRTQQEKICVMQGGVLPSEGTDSHNFIICDITEQDPEIVCQTRVKTVLNQASTSEVRCSHACLQFRQPSTTSCWVLKNLWDLDKFLWGLIIHAPCHIIHSK